MAETVKSNSPLRSSQVAETERRIIEAATRLFLADGYVGTKLTTVAEEAGVGARTIYVRFGTKAELFRRVIETAIVGDTAAVAVMEREWVRTSLVAPTATERLAAWAAAARQIMERAGGLFEVGIGAAAIEPAIEEQFSVGRTQLHADTRRVVMKMAENGMLEWCNDLQWLIDTVAVLCAPDTYLLGTRMVGWNLDAYQAWLEATLISLIRTH